MSAKNSIRRTILYLSLVFFATASLSTLATSCGSDNRKKPVRDTNNTSNSNNANNANNANNLNNENNASNINNINNIDPELCGNGELDPNEVCDPAIENGEGQCPTECPAVSCANSELAGTAESCTARCVVAPFACADEDGCCPAGCDSQSDSDCTNTCGNGMVEGNETCDGDCPTSCDDGNPCTVGALSGSPDTCNVQCEYSPKTQCVNDDGCCPAGCTTQTDNDCACNPTSSCSAQGAECGSVFDGCSLEQCGVCGDEEECDQATNTCIDTSTPIGEACTSTAQCGGSPYDCLPAADIGWIGGYCSRGCSVNSDCGPGAHCSSDAGLCLQSCSSNGECRSDYGCYDFDGDGLNECAPVANGSGAVGDACTYAADCSGGETGDCLRQTFTWYNGYCIESCTTNVDCPSSSHCFDSAICVKSCTTSSSCRTGYICLDSDSDGVKECVPGATGTREVGDPCTGVWQCSGGEHGFCNPEDDDGTIQGGYCFQECGAGGLSCPSGSSCVDVEGDSYCFQDCSTSSDCRTGYTCGSTTASDGSTVDVCWL